MGVLSWMVPEDLAVVYRSCSGWFYLPTLRIQGDGHLYTISVVFD